MVQTKEGGGPSAKPALVLYFLSSDNPGQKLGQAVSLHENHFPSAMRRELTTYLTGSTGIAVTIVQSLLPPLGGKETLWTTGNEPK
jgi:hypothetical protein